MSFLSKKEAQEIINNKKITKLSYTNLLIQGGDGKLSGLFSGFKMAIAI